MRFSLTIPNVIVDGNNHTFYISGNTDTQNYTGLFSGGYTNTTLQNIITKPNPADAAPMIDVQSGYITGSSFHSTSFAANGSTLTILNCENFCHINQGSGAGLFGIILAQGTLHTQL